MAVSQGLFFPSYLRPSSEQPQSRYYWRTYPEWCAEFGIAVGAVSREFYDVLPKVPEDGHMTACMS